MSGTTNQVSGTSNQFFVINNHLSGTKRLVSGTNTEVSGNKQSGVWDKHYGVLDQSWKKFWDVPGAKVGDLPVPEFFYTNGIIFHQLKGNTSQFLKTIGHYNTMVQVLHRKEILINQAIFTATARRALVVMMSKCVCVCLYVFLYVMSHFLGLWLVKNIIVIEVEVDELHEGKKLSRPSLSMTISAASAGKQEKWAELCRTRK